MQKASARVTLTKSDLDSEHGAKLVALILEATSDGVISDEEILALHSEICAMPQEIAGIRHLRATIEDIAADTCCDESERTSLWRQFERVLPPEERKKIEAIRKQNEALQKEADRKRKAAENDLRAARSETARGRASWHDDPPTAAQLSYIKGLRGDPKSVRTKGEASALIDSLIRTPDSFTPRQRMILRFWDVTPPPNWSKLDVSEWMDAWYAEDPDRLTAWEAFKESICDTGTSTDPNRVPVGAGAKWLALVKSNSASESPMAAHEWSPPPVLPAREALVTTPTNSDKAMGVGTILLAIVCAAMLLIAIVAFVAR